MDANEPILNWVREDDHNVVITGGAVRAGKPVRMQVRWDQWGSYMGPERFTVHRSRKALGAFANFRTGETVTRLEADVDGPPTTHSLQAWQAGSVDPLSNQSRYYFTDAHRNKSGTLTVSNVAHYTSAPSFQVDAGFEAPLPGRTGVAAHAGRARTVFHIGATTDPTVRVTLLRATSNELTAYMELQGFHGRPYSPDEFDDRRWRPVFEMGDSELVFDVDEDHLVEVGVVPQRPYEDRGVPFTTYFALRVETVHDPSEFVISDVVTVQDMERSRSIDPYPYPGVLLFR
jgi:hypothetical protein